MKEQKVEEVKLVDVEEVEEWKVKKILNKRKIRGVVKYLVWWKRFIAEHNSWKRKKDLENAKETIIKFKERLSIEVRWQEKLDRIEERDFRRGKLLEKYIAKMLYGWNNKKFEEEYLRKLEKNWQKWKLVSPEEKSWRRDNVRIVNNRLYFIFPLLFLFLFLFYYSLKLEISMTLESYYHKLSHGMT